MGVGLVAVDEMHAQILGRTPVGRHGIIIESRSEGATLVADGLGHLFG
jgi:hypothetical protein